MLERMRRTSFSRQKKREVKMRGRELWSSCSMTVEACICLEMEGCVVSY